MKVRKARLMNPTKEARLRKQLTRSKFTEAEWIGAADRASAARRAAGGNGRYTPPRRKG